MRNLLVTTVKTFFSENFRCETTLIVRQVPFPFQENRKEKKEDAYYATVTTLLQKQQWNFFIKINFLRISG